MQFKAIEFMEWAKMDRKTEINLHKSSVENCRLKSLDLDLEDLELTGSNVYGYLPLLETLAARFGVQKEEIVSTMGTSQAIYLICAALLENGDEVIIEKPTYEPLVACPRAFGANLIHFDRLYKNRYDIDLDRLESLISPKTRLIILTNLHNPSGVLIPRSILKDLACLAEKKGIFVFIDEIYLEFLDGEERETSFSLSENIIVASSLTKVYGLGGLRCGWIIVPPLLAKKLKRINDYINVEGVFISEQISNKIIPHLDSLAKKNKPQIEQKMSMIKKLISEEGRLSWVVPDGGVICFPRVEIDNGGDKLASVLLEKYDTSVVPGKYFEDSLHFRLGLGVPQEILERGLENISKALSEM